MSLAELPGLRFEADGGEWAGLKPQTVRTTRSEAMKRPVTSAAVSFVLLSSGAVLASSAQGGRPEVQILGGQLYLEEELLLDGFSLVQTELKYLFFYVPAVGLITISPAEFPGAEQAGRFQGERLTFEAGGKRFTLAAQRPILAGADRPAWVSLDPGYSLDVDSVMFGYGDEATAPEEWPQHVRRGR